MVRASLNLSARVAKSSIYYCDYYRKLTSDHALSLKGYVMLSFNVNSGKLTPSYEIKENIS